MRRLLLATLVALSAALLDAPLGAPLAAQGALSIQGFGYPTGQQSPRAAATASALGEIDAGSPLNPAALLGAGKSIFSFQMDPEFRQVKLAGRTVNTTTARFPVITVGTRVGLRGFIGGSFSTLLDRTWDAAYGDSVSVGGQRVASTVATRVRGAINDARLAFAWQFSEKWQAGAAFHALTGANRMNLTRRFNDSTTFGTLSQSMTLAYGGSALSAGVVGIPLPHVILGASLRLGGAMSTRYDDSVATHGKVPNRLGASLSYDGIPGSTISLRASREQWSRMRPLGSASLDVHDVTELAAGVEVAGPKFQGSASQLRFGVKTRDLPFGWNGHVVSEQVLAFGGGLTFAHGWASLDAGLQRAQRKAAGLSETGTILSVGLTVRP